MITDTLLNWHLTPHDGHERLSMNILEVHTGIKILINLTNYHHIVTADQVQTKHHLKQKVTVSNARGSLNIQE